MEMAEETSSNRQLEQRGQQQAEEAEQFSENEVTADGKNVNTVMCTQCGSIVLRAQTAIFEEGTATELPLPYQKKRKGGPSIGDEAGEAHEVQTEQHDRWWTVTDMFAFENVGFTHSFRGTKFLACADCEIGPIGFVCAETGKFLVAVKRVRHQKS